MRPDVLQKTPVIQVLAKNAKELHKVCLTQIILKKSLQLTANIKQLVAVKFKNKIINILN
jgi:hypothetical protein